jgi:EAL domain-containing protein (putative c-di-GMP-specific phosphodiesterase class I)
MEIKTVAEFVHSKNVAEKVKEMGVDFSQGYYFGEPTDTIR